MTRKHFIAIAEELKNAHTLVVTDTAQEPYQRHFAWAVTMGCVADALNRQNPNFNRDRFIAACKPADCEECAR